MATVAGLRETLRQQLGDIQKASKDKRFSNELLETALFDGILTHAKGTSWDKLPQGEDQLVLILAKARLCKDKAAEFALDPKLASGGGFSREKNGNASLLMQLARDYREEYESIKQELASEDTGDIIVSDFFRRSGATAMQTPTQIAPTPKQPVLQAVRYEYRARGSTTVPNRASGAIHVDWDPKADVSTAFIRVYLSTMPTLENGQNEIIRTLYDFSGVYPDPAWPVQNRLAQRQLVIDKTITPTGQWYLIMCAVNWNMLTAYSEPYQFDVEPYISVNADVFLQEPAA